MNRAIKRFVICMSVIMMTLTLSFSVSAETLPSDNGYNYTVDNHIVPDRVIYNAVSNVTGKQSGTDNFSLPEDIFVYENHIYVADTGNARIVVLDQDLNFVREMAVLRKNGENDCFITPTGIFVSSEGILVCDKDGERAVLLNEDGEILSEYLKPESETLKDISFYPTKCVMDDYGNVYILSNGIYQGILQYSLDGEFLNFFGSNVIENTLSLKVSRFWKKFFNKSASEQMARDIPMEYNNMYIDPSGFIYGTIYKTNTGSNNLKKLNARGKNILTHIQDNSSLDRNRYGDQKNFVIKGETWDTTLIDVTVDKNGIISVLDNTWCRIFQYNQDGDIIGEFGGKGDIIGTFSGPSAIEILDDNILVLDKLKGTITRFVPTDYRKMLDKALWYYSNGEYQESIHIWQEVIKENSNIPLAYKSIGKAYMQQGKLHEALENFKIAGDRESYSLVFGRLRQDFIKRNIFYIIIAAAVLIGIFKLLHRLIHNWIWKTNVAKQGEESND